MSDLRSATCMQQLRRAGAEALRAQHELLNAWRGMQKSDAADATLDDVCLLKEMFIQRIYPINAFELICAVDLQCAIELIINLYLGVNVDPDTKFGGFQFELDSLIGDLKEAGGLQKIIQLVNHPRFALDRVDDQRVCEVLSNVLEIDTGMVSQWVQTQRAAIET